MYLVKLDEPFDHNWWLTRECLLLTDVDTVRRMRQSLGRRFGSFMNWESVEYFYMTSVDSKHLIVQFDSEWSDSWEPIDLLQETNSLCFS